MRHEFNNLALAHETMGMLRDLKHLLRQTPPTPWKDEYFLTNMRVYLFRLASAVRTLVFTFVFTLLLVVFHTGVAMAQNPNQNQAPAYESYGHTLNVGVGAGYYGYLGQSIPIAFFDYEFDVARNFTLAPFIGIGYFRSNANYYYDGNGYYYSETVIPLGVKGTYYFDRLLHLNRNWDLYLAASLGYFYDRAVWQNGYNGNEGVAESPSPLYLNFHAGVEYHVSDNIGIFADLSTGVSTIGLAFHNL